MADLTTTILAFDHGIERLLDGHETGTFPLPQRAYLSPSEDQVRPRLDDIVRPQSLDDKLQDFLRPAISDREILAPARYGALLDSALRKLGQLSPDADPVLREAVDVLTQEQELRRLLDTYRNMLVKG